MLDKALKLRAENRANLLKAAMGMYGDDAMMALSPEEEGKMRTLLQEEKQEKVNELFRQIDAADEKMRQYENTIRDLKDEVLTLREKNVTLLEQAVPVAADKKKVT